MGFFNDFDIRCDDFCISPQPLFRANCFNAAGQLGGSGPIVNSAENYRGERMTKWRERSREILQPQLGRQCRSASGWYNEYNNKIHEISNQKIRNRTSKTSHQSSSHFRSHIIQEFTIFGYCSSKRSCRIRSSFWVTVICSAWLVNYMWAVHIWHKRRKTRKIFAGKENWRTGCHPKI